jgi:hypothetical protein
LRAARALAREHAEASRARDEFMQHLETLGIELGAEDADPRGVAAGSSHAGDEAAAGQIVGHANDRNDRGGGLHGSDADIAESDDDVDAPRHELMGESGQCLALSVRPAVLEADVAALLPAEPTHVALERHGEWLGVPGVDAQDADDRHGHRQRRGNGQC